MKRKIIVNNKEFTMPKMSIDTYTEYLELAEIVDAKQRYSKQDIEAMGLFICKAVCFADKKTHRLNVLF